MHETDRQPVISVVVPCKGHAEVLADCLGSLDAQSFAEPFEIIVIDSADDGAVRAVAARFANVRLLSSRGDLLPGAARNLGVEHARSDRVAFIDADCLAEPGWLAAAWAGLAEGALMVGGPVLDALPGNPFALTDNLLQFADFPPGRPDGAARYFPACNMAVRRAVFRQVGGFMDTGMPAGEDTLLCEAFAPVRANALLYRGAMRVRHRGRETLAALCRHHAMFGRCRAVHGLHLDARRRRQCRHAALLPAVIAKRGLYIYNRLYQWRRRALPRALLLLPLVTIGLTAWAIGFRRGCREAVAAEHDENHAASDTQSAATTANATAAKERQS